MAKARAFFDLHHQAIPTAYNGDDFQLIVDDGSGNAVWADGSVGGNIDETTYTDFQTGINGENSVSRQAIASGNPIAMGGYNNRDEIDTSNNVLRNIGMLGYTFMDNVSGVIDPTAYVQNNANFNLFACRLTVSSGSNFNDCHIFTGRMFCTSQGKPTLVNIGGVKYAGFGMQYRWHYNSNDKQTEMYFGFLKPLSYPSSPDNQKNADGYFDIQDNFEVVSDHTTYGDNLTSYEVQVDGETYQSANFETGSLLSVSNINSSYHEHIDAMFNNYSLPLIASTFYDFSGSPSFDDIGSKFFNI